MKMIKHNNILTMFFTVLILVIFFTSFTLAWISTEVSKEVNTSFGTFELSCTLTSNNKDVVFDHGTYLINGLSQVDQEAIFTRLPDLAQTVNISYIESLNISIVITAEIAGYMRVKLLDEWAVTRKYYDFDRESSESIFRSDDNLFPYELAEGWVYDKVTRYCYYTKLIEKGTKDTIPFIVSGTSYTPKTSSFFYELCEVAISTSLEVVQANRYEALWGITSIPSNGGNQ